MPRRRSRRTGGGPPQRRSRFPSQRKQEKRKIAKGQMQRLIEMALSQSSRDPDLSQRYAALAWKMSTRFNVRLGKARRLFCHYCKKFIPPGAGSRYRLSRKRWGINITCLYCGKTYRALFGLPSSKAK